MVLDDDLREIFMAEVEGYLRVLTDADASHEARGDAAHGLKGAAGMLGFDELQSLASLLEEDRKSVV